jgi:cytochrome c553
MAAAAALCGLLFVLSPSAQAAGDPVRGGAQAETCAACHGVDGNSTIASIPSLAGQPETFLTLQLILFREGVRRVPPMLEVSRALADQDLVDLAAFFARLPPAPRPEPRDDARYARGAELSRRLLCGNCHLPGYVGRAQMPRLAGQREDYLLHALREFAGNIRPGIDTSMNAALYGLADADLVALAHYLAQQP